MSIRFQRLAALALACLIPTTALPQSSRRPAPPAPTGRLFITVDLKGSGRKDLSNKVEWYRLTANRKLELELAMYMPMKSPAAMIKVGGIDQNNAPMPEGMAALKNAVEGCKGDQACERQAATAIMQKMMANPGGLGAMQPDNSRFQNWVADRRVPCATGTATVEDEGDGVNISPPAPAKPYKFQRTGKLDLSGQPTSVLDKACQAEISVDLHKGLLSLRLNGLSIPVPVQMSGQAYTKENSVTFLEGRGKFELFDQPIKVDEATWSGQGRFENIGSVSHNSGQTVAPMTGTLIWRLVRD
ncbi:hypothetical protein IC232_19590 [Microvirga sp. BT688]|uniref:hypothetical protein n=1 Tax=Microvirga sp. TaxID=1873136 RepID=UPI0016868944|nr:hypothetical protein [Microvirga sp.]MBD2748894.1 hypothetical protein [Microvirga sp.]